MISGLIAWTGLDYWNPLLWLGAFILLLILVYLIRSFGNKSYAKGTAQTEPFQSGNVKEPDENVSAGDVYWGFMEALGSLYRPLVRFHTGIVNDYVAIFIIVLALILLLVLLL